jgi:hypothetical protein
LIIQGMPPDARVVRGSWLVIGERRLTAGHA